MVIIQLQGGLGNQLFQYARGRALADALGKELYIDCEFLQNRDYKENFTFRNYELNHFNIRGEIASKTLLKSIAAYPFSRWSIYKRKLLTWTNKVEYIHERGYDYFSKSSDWKPITYLSGFWQSEKYFQNSESSIAKDITINESPGGAYLDYIELIKSHNAVSIHIRRGDYVNNKMHPLCDMEYYKSAIQFILNRVENPTFFIFSDDIEWAKANIYLDKPHFFVEQISSKSYIDMKLMSNCAHQIIANSTYSWWAAWLNKNPEKIVITPNKWFGNDSNTKDLIPEKWKII